MVGCLVIHVSALATPTRYLQTREQVSLLKGLPEISGQPVHALLRVTLEGWAKV